MEIVDLFKEVRNLVQDERFDELKDLKAEKPQKFNWYNDVFEPLDVQSHPDDKALLWIYNDERRDFTFNELHQKTNQFLNFLRKHGIGKGDKLFAQLPLVPINWIGYLACIKGGMIIIPTATTMAVRGLEFRFESIFPEVALADAANAEKVDLAEAKFDKKIKLKLIVGAE